jgi:hypothetical protein
MINFDGLESEARLFDKIKAILWLDKAVTDEDLHEMHRQIGELSKGLALRTHHQGLHGEPCVGLSFLTRGDVVDVDVISPINEYHHRIPMVTLKYAGKVVKASVAKLEKPDCHTLGQHTVALAAELMERNGITLTVIVDGKPVPLPCEDVNSFIQDPYSWRKEHVL